MKYIVKILPWVALVIILLLWRGTCNKKESQETLYNAAQDTLKITRNELGQQVASIQVLQTTNKKQFLDLKTNDSTIIALQQLVKKTKNLQSAIVVVNHTSNSISGNTVVTNSGDSIIKDSLVYVYPEYSFSRVTEWDSVNIISNKNTTKLDYKIFNEYDITVSYKKKGLFKGKIPIIDMTNKNPYTETVALRAYQIQCDCKRGQFFAAGIGVGAVGVLSLQRLLTK